MSDKNEIALRRRAALKSLGEDPEEYTAYLQKLAPTKVKRIQGHLGRMSHGLHAVAPIICKGLDACPFASHCPIPSRSPEGELIKGPDADYPLGMSCVLETMYQRQKIIEYMEHLEVDPRNPVETAIVNDLAIIDLYKNRAMMIMSGGDRDEEGRDFLRVDITNYTDEGLPTKSTQLHPALEVIDRLERRRERLLDRLVETRKGKVDIDIKRGKATQESDLLQELRAVREWIANNTGATVEDDEPVLLDD